MCNDAGLYDGGNADGDDRNAHGFLIDCSTAILSNRFGSHSKGNRRSRAQLQRHPGQRHHPDTSLYDGQGIDEADLQELRQYLDQISAKK